MKKKVYTALSGVFMATAVFSPTVAMADDIPEIPSLPDSYVSGGTGQLQVEFHPIPDEARTKIFEQENDDTPTVTTSTTTVTPSPRTTQRTVTVAPEDNREQVTSPEQVDTVSDESIILPPDWEGFIDEYAERSVNDSLLPPVAVADDIAPNVSSTISSMAPTYDSAVAQSIIDYAYSQLGVPYVWGGTTTDAGLDCSGLTQNAYAAAGISIPRVTYDQINSGPRIPVSSIEPGDLVFYNSTQHVAIYIGDGQVIHAPTPGQVVTIDSLTMMPVQTVVRPAGA